MSYLTRLPGSPPLTLHDVQEEADGTVTVVEVVLVPHPGHDPFEGTAGSPADDVVGAHFDDRIARLAVVVRHPDTPARRVRITASTPAAVEHLTRRARAVAPDVDITGVHVPAQEAR